MIIAREAGLLLVVASAAAVLAYLSCGFVCALPLILIALFIAYMFREPGRRVPPAPLGIVSPVDGRAVVMGEAHDPFLGRQAAKISIRMNAMGPFAVRAPIEGRVMQQWYLPEGLDSHLLGNSAAAALTRDPAAKQGHYAIWVQSDEEDDVVLVLRGALIARRLSCAVQVGERIGQGQRCGLVRLAATADLYVPANSRIEAAQGAVVRAGSDIIATLVHK